MCVGTDANRVGSIDIARRAAPGLMHDLVIAIHLRDLEQIAAGTVGNHDDATVFQHVLVLAVAVDLDLCRCLRSIRILDDEPDIDTAAHRQCVRVARVTFVAFDTATQVIDVACAGGIQVVDELAAIAHATPEACNANIA